QAEGWAMLSSVLSDFCRLPDVNVVTLLNRQNAHHARSDQFATVISDQEENAFRTLAGTSDFSLVIAPEFEDLLVTRMRWVEEAGGGWMGRSGAAAGLTGDKYECGEFLRQRRIPVVESWLVQEDITLAELPFPAVLKPRWGAGSQATFLLGSKQELKSLPQ